LDAVRGEVTASLLRQCERAVVDGGFDVVIVCLHRSDFAYLQNQRDGAGQQVLSDDEARTTEELGTLASEGRLSLFLGAGVSVAAGAPDYRELVRRASGVLGGDDDPATSGQASQVAGRLITTHGEVSFFAAVKRSLGQTGTALLHGLLASTRTSGVMTTNFDDLFERSAAVSLAGTRLDVLPWDRERRTPWLLKMHGSVGRSGRLVITSDDLASFNDEERPLASIVQAQLLLSDVLFVGYSLHDPNVQQLATQVRDLLRREGHQRQTVGTVLAIEPLGGAVAELENALEVVDLSDAGQVPLPEAARRLEVFCDVLLWHATRKEPAWQLDDRYAVVGPDQDLRTELRALKVPVGGNWDRLRDVLEEYGLGGRRHR
jgi:NAD-dependent SIR2 family protein deacetylase